MKKLILLLSLPLAVVAQQNEIRVNGYFIQDTTQVGMPLEYVLKAEYDLNQSVIFPDTLYDFTPFELDGKRYFYSSLAGNTVIDSAVYELTTFELDTVQYLNLPVFDVTEGDSSAVYGTPDFVTLTFELTQLPDTVKLLDNAIYFDPSYPADHVLIMVVAGSIVLTGAIIFIIFFGRIRRWWIMEQIKKRHKRFVQAFETTHHKTNDIQPIELLERLTGLWKSHMEYLTGKPVASYTSREMVKNLHEEELLEPLKSIDKAIYAGLNNQSLFEEFEVLKNKVQQYYLAKLEEVQHA